MADSEDELPSLPSLPGSRRSTPAGPVRPPAATLAGQGTTPDTPDRPTDFWRFARAQPTVDDLTSSLATTGVYDLPTARRLDFARAGPASPASPAAAAAALAAPVARRRTRDQAGIDLPVAGAAAPSGAAAAAAARPPLPLPRGRTHGLRLVPRLRNPSARPRPLPPPSVLNSPRGNNTIRQLAARFAAERDLRPEAMAPQAASASGSGFGSGSGSMDEEDDDEDQDRSRSQGLWKRARGAGGR